MMDSDDGFSLIVPVFNEELAIADTLDRLREIIGDQRHEIIVVDDGSTDGTSEILAQRSDIRCLRHAENLGYGAALKTGIRAARHELIAIADGDGTYPLEEIPALVRRLQSYDMVVGARIGDNVQYSRIRSFPKVFLKLYAQWIARHPIPDLNSGLRAFRRRVVLSYLKVLPNGFSFTTTITVALLANRHPVEFRPIDYAKRIGKSKIQPIRDTIRFAQLIVRTGIYFAPLRVIMPVAWLFFVAAAASLYNDVFRLGDLTDSSLILLGAGTQITLFALLADMVDKRSSS
ncbi:MAG: glycosyltransferase family 2 protein [Acidobacteria bacterium]|nr:MAG: glycosyltransferase family 2 protein [Acidobacteriota bacterium]REK04373.1 MAG: glycosyltransferase family 2 protein [Acidobacteriota bacterium]